MKGLAMLFMLVLMVFQINAQEVKEVSKDGLSRKERKELKKKKRTRAFDLKKEKGARLLSESDFVLRANRLSLPTGPDIPVSDDVNFVKVEGDTVTFQYGFNGVVGRNGLGGETLKGKIVGKSLKDQGEGKSYAAVIDFLTPLALEYVVLYIYIEGDKARAKIFSNGNFVNLRGPYMRVKDSELWYAANRTYY